MPDTVLAAIGTFSPTFKVILLVGVTNLTLQAS